VPSLLGIPASELFIRSVPLGDVWGSVETALLTWLYKIAIIHRMKVSVAVAKNKLPELIKAAEDGETVTICRRGVPVVDIVRTKKPSRKKRRLGTLKGKIQVLEPGWWKPMSDDEVDAFVEGRD
jgi:prevent-host-death family protein